MGSAFAAQDSFHCTGKISRLRPFIRFREIERESQLIQIDGSHEFWFEDRGEKCVLLVFVDDATEKLTALHFSKSESLEGYFRTLEKHLLRYGRLQSVYSDRFSVFDSSVEKNLSQFQRALTTLDIKSILAFSPQAKGRVERMKRTLQDRLIKEMRLKKISSIDEAKKFVPEFVEMYNLKFSKEPASEFDAHRPLGTEVDFSRVLSRYEERTLSKDAMFQFHNKFYKITKEMKGMTLRGRKIEVRVGREGRGDTSVNSRKFLSPVLNLLLPGCALALVNRTD